MTKDIDREVYLISPDAYATFSRVFRYHYFDLVRSALLKYGSRFIHLNSIEEDRFNHQKISDFLVIYMIIANARNVERISSDPNFIGELPTTDRLAQNYLSSGSCNHRWLEEVETSKQLIVKAFDWYLSQSIDTQSDSAICQLIEEINGKYAVELVKQMPGSWLIPSVLL